MVSSQASHDCVAGSSVSPSPWPASGETRPASHCASRLDAEKFSRARAASTLAHSKTSPGSSCRQVRPQLPSSLTGESSDSPFFQALNSLMKEKVDQDSEAVEGSHVSALSEGDSLSADRASRLAFTRARWWFTVKRRAPAHLANKILCCAFGSRANWNVTDRESTCPV